WSFMSAKDCDLPIEFANGARVIERAILHRMDLDITTELEYALSERAAPSDVDLAPVAKTAAGFECKWPIFEMLLAGCNEQLIESRIVIRDLCRCHSQLIEFRA